MPGPWTTIDVTHIAVEVPVTLKRALMLFLKLFTIHFLMVRKTPNSLSLILCIVNLNTSNTCEC
jgi:hypothetical protein